MANEPKIRVRGARQNNLAGFDIDLPQGKLIVVTGPSGSGKSSFAFDTVYAEGQRRYVETFSPYTRQFLERMDKPKVDGIDGIPPAIAIEQANHIKSTRSTVGTITEVLDYLKLLFPRVAKCFCPSCQREVVPESASLIVEQCLRQHAGKTLLVLFRVPRGDATKNPGEFLDFLRGQGYLRIFLSGKVLRTDDPELPERLPAEVCVVQDRIRAEESNRARMEEAVEAALRLGRGKMEFVDEDSRVAAPHSKGWHCAHCDIDIRPPSPGLFSFNNPLGACPECRGFGRVIGIDYERALPDKSLSIAEGVVRPFQAGFSRECQTDLLKHCARQDIDIDVPFEELPEADQRFVIEGENRDGVSAEEAWDNGLWYGVKGYFDWLESRTYKMHVRVLLSRYRAYRLCPACNGGRYQPDTLNYRLQTDTRSVLTLPQLNALPVGELRTVLASTKIAPGDESAALLQNQVVTRLSYLEQVGLGYLSLDRPSRTLSGGEMERVNLTSCLGASLVNTLFVMDEPSVGLHPRDTGRLIGVMERLRDKGNTLLVVEHEEAVIRAADHLVDIGPGRGKDGGRLVYNGPSGGILSQKDSLTAGYLSGEKQIPIPSKRKKPRDFIKLKGIRHHNLQRVDVQIPLGVLCCVTGVSGSGKTSLVHDVLFRNLDLNPISEAEAPGFCRDVECPLDLEEVVMVDQSSLAKTPRSTPVVYLGVYDRVREMFGLSADSISSGFTPSSFSFNAGNGRCERCQGLGFEKVEMQFLSDLFLRCPECEGKRFQDSLLKIRIAGKNIHEVLEMTVSEAVEFFQPLESKKEITGPLRLLAEVGLEYLRLGQPLNTLSGGESQRLKLVRRLLEGKKGEGVLMIFDEPTTGLHFDDIRLLINVFQRLVAEGHSLLVVEHNLEVIKCADWILDLGPEAGAGGGKLVAAGTPEKISLCEASHTGRYLRSVLDPESTPRVLRGTVQESPADTAQNISVRGAREHNLKNISIDLPRNELVVITGLSGSGKSTLAFDLLFAEGQRRFLDSMSPYARQFVEQLEKPEVDSIEGLPPTVAIEQRVTRGGGKSTVATVTEVYHFLRLLFARVGTQFCPKCEVPVEKSTPAAVAARAAKLLSGGKLQVFAPVVRGRKGFHTEVARWAARQGFEFLLVDGALVPVAGFQKLERFKEHTIDVLIGELGKKEAADLEKIVRRALDVGKGTAKLLDSKGKFHLISTEMNCPSCGTAFEELDPRLFSHHSPHGWCTHCKGFGEVWKPTSERDYDSVAEQELAEEKKFESLEKGESVRCPICSGSRLNETARAVRLQDKRIHEVVSLSSRQALGWLGSLKFTGAASEITKDLLPEIAQRLSFLEEVGLDYVSLDRSAKTLSGGESQRIRLASQLGSNLRGVLYVLDEPTIGLHPRDNDRLLNALGKLVEKGNSLVVVEHDEDTMRRATRIIDLGPGAGSGGGEVVASGRLEEILANPHSLTGKFLREPMAHPLRGERRELKTSEWIELHGASKHNLRGVDLKIPVGRLSVITGVSGSGKSTLIRSVFLPAVRDALRNKRATRHSTDPSWKSFTGAGHLSGVTEVDQSPIGKTSRSTPATYIKVFDEIRKLLASLPDAKMRGYSASRFSFNNEGGRCESCQGQGVIRLEMSFLPVSHMPCEDCGGRRYNRPTLEVLYNGKSIGDVMMMSIAEAADFFAAVPKIRRPLQLMKETGLGYLRLGQPSPTLSGGEAQRIKLVSELARKAGARETLVRTGRVTKSALFVLEEPTIGLHAADVVRLIDVIHRLIEEGGTVVVIEHHLDLIAEADWVVDLGPGAGDLGGKIVCEGTPEQIASCSKSETGKFLRTILSPKAIPSEPNVAAKGTKKTRKNPPRGT